MKTCNIIFSVIKMTINISTYDINAINKKFKVIIIFSALIYDFLINKLLLYFQIQFVINQI